MRKVIFVVLLISSLLAAACGSVNTTGEKIAVADWKKVVAGHPQYKKLQQGEAIVQDLVKKRKAQEEMAKQQLSSLDKLRELKNVSEVTYWDADFNTRMVGAQARENVKLQKFMTQTEKEAEELVAERKREVESSYQLKMFNLRMRLESVKMKPDERKIVENELTAARNAREAELAELNSEKAAYIEKKLAPYAKQMQQRMGQEADRLRQNAAAVMQASEGKYDDMLQKAPSALQNALSIMDREIDKQQEKNAALEKEINQDIENVVMRLVDKNGYTIVFNTVKVNLTADDITDKIISELQKEKNK